MEADTRRVLTRRKPLSDCTNSQDRTSSRSSVPVKPTKPNPSSSSTFNKPPFICSSGTATRSNILRHVFSNARNPSYHEPPIVSTTTPPLKTSSLYDTSTSIDRDVSEHISAVIGPSHDSDQRNCDNASNSSSLPSSNVSTPPGPPKTFSVAGAIDLDLSESISTVYSRRRTSDKRKNKEKAMSRPVSCTPTPKISNSREKVDGVELMDLSKAKALTVPCRKRKRAVPSEQDMSKDAVLQEFIEQQKAYFKEIDEFELQEEEVESIDELD